MSCTKKEAESEEAPDFRIGYSLFYGSNPFAIAMLQGAEQCARDWKEKNITVQLIANNIPVVVTDIGLSDAERVSFITTDNAKGGTGCDLSHQPAYSAWQYGEYQVPAGHSATPCGL